MSYYGMNFYNDSNGKEKTEILDEIAECIDTGDVGYPLRIKEHPDYWVTDSGEVLSLKSKAIKVLKPDVSNGYPRIILDGERYYLADLVARYFLGPKPDQSYKIFYIDGDKTNCDVSNLKWMNLSDIQRYWRGRRWKR